MEQTKEDNGTRKDLMLYLLQTAKADLKSIGGRGIKGANKNASNRAIRENYNLVLVRATLHFRRSNWYGIKPYLDKKHWKGKFAFQYDSQKLCDFYEKKIKNAWGRKGEEKQDWKVYTEEILGDTMFMVIPRNDYYWYHYDLVDAIKDVDSEGEVGWLAGYVLSSGWIEEMEKENRE